MHLENQFMLGVDSYQKTLTEAYNLTIKWKASPIKQVENVITNEGVTLAMDVEKEKGYLQDQMLYLQKIWTLPKQLSRSALRKRWGAKTSRDSEY